MEMISILFHFTRSMKDGNWQLYLTSIAEMMQCFAINDHVNYAWW